MMKNNDSISYEYDGLMKTRPSHKDASAADLLRSRVLRCAGVVLVDCGAVGVGDRRADDYATGKPQRDGALPQAYPTSPRALRSERFRVRLILSPNSSVDPSVALAGDVTTGMG
jgi:hypothetical protein